MLPLLLQVTFESPTICNCLFHIFGFSLLPNVVKETALTIALTFKKNTASNELAKHPSLQNEARFEICFSQIGPAGTTQLLPRSGRNLIPTLKVQLLQGRSCARLPAGRQPHRRLWYHRQSTWSAQKKTVGIKGRQSVFRSSCK